MQLKSYNFSTFDKVYVSDGNGGFVTVDKEKLTDGYNMVLEVGNDGTSKFLWEFDGAARKDFYVKDEYGNIVKLQFNDEDIVSCCVNNPNTGTSKSFGVDYEDGSLKSNGEIGFIVGEDGSLTSQRIIVPPGRYRRDKECSCRHSFKVKDMEVYNDLEHAAWYGEPKIDGVREPARANLVKIPDSVLNSLTTRFIELKAFADAYNIKLIVDEYRGDIRAVMVPRGYKVESDDGRYEDFIPYELMPVIGKCSFTFNEDSDYQPVLKEDKPE